MKIVIAAEIFPPDIGGPATYSKNLAQELVKRGWDVKLICYSDQDKVDGDPDYVTRIKRSKFKFLHYKKYFSTLKKLSKDCDVIYAMGPVSSGLPVLKVSKTLNKKMIVKVVGDYAWESARNSGKTNLGIDEFQNKKNIGRIDYLQKIERQVCQGADKVIVPSQYLKKIVKGWGVDESEIKVVYNSFEISMNNTNTEKKKFLIISAARLVSWKGFDALISVVNDLTKEKSDIRLEIIGDGPLHNQFKNKITRLNNKSIQLIGSVPRDEFLKRLKTASLFILNTDYEGLSHVILEAMSCQVPVITTNVGGNPELIKDGMNGFLVEFNNKDQIKKAILKLYGDENETLRRDFVINSNDILPQFTFEKMINNTINVLENL